MASKARRRTSVCLTSIVLGIATILASSKGVNGQQDGYYGRYIGKFKTLHHNVAGEVFAVDARTLHIRDFSYDGQGPAAFFYAGSSKNPSPSGFRINDEKGLTTPLQRYRNKHVTISLPDGKTLNNIKWLSVWCDEFAVNFGDVKIPKNLDYPRPQKIDPLKGGHLVSSDPIVIVDAQTLLIPHFSYDGQAPDAKFWVGRGNKPSPQGIRVPDENGKENPLRKYDRKNIVLTLPGDLTVFDIGHFGVWCEAFTVDFGHVLIPRGLNVPPSLKMLGVSPQSKLNCEVLWDDLAFEVRWAVAGDSIVMQLVGKLADGEYMSFGLSGDDFHSKMIGGDVVVAWVDRETFKGAADDYFLESKAQCSGRRGSCPDTVFREGTNSVSPLNAAIVNGYSIVTYQRSLQPQDEFDRQVYTNRSQPVIWAIGPLNDYNQVSYHSLANKEDLFINFGRAPKWNCPIPESDAPSSQQQAHSPVRVPAVQQLPPPDDTVATSAVSTRSRRPQATPAPVPKIDPWKIPPIQCDEPDDGIFYAQLGPTGGKRGYPAITGHVGWGIAWYINGLLIPEINVVRGKTYTFYVEGGNDSEVPVYYHPFYITDDPVGGYEHKTPEEREKVRIFAGARQNRRGEVYPTGVGRHCHWTPDPDKDEPDEYASFGAYQRILTLICDPGDPGVITWTPDNDTPDTVYYQCFEHRYLGWKINVLDSCDLQFQGSDPVPVQVEADLEEGDEEEDDIEGELQGRPSIQVATRVRPDFLPPGTKVEETQSYKYIPLNEFSQQPVNTQQNFGNPAFPFSYEPVTSTTDLPADSATSKSEHYEEHRTPVSDTDKPQAQPLVQSAPSYQQIYNNFESSVVLHPQHHNLQEATSDDKTPVSNVESIVAEEETKYKGEADESVKQQASQSSNLNVTLPSEAKINVQQATVRPALTLVPGKQFHPHSTTLLPLNHKRPPGGRFPVHPQMMIQRPQQYTLPHFRRPVSLPPHRGFTRPPPPGVFRPQYHNQLATAASVQHNYIINPKKPIYRPMSAHHTVRPVLPHQYNRPSVINPYSLPRVPPSGTIPLQTSPAPVRHILMSIAPSTNLSPLKLRKISTSPITSTSTATSTSTSTSTTTPLPTVIKNSIKSSQPLPSSDLVLVGAESSIGLPIAVNTGFNPHSVVVEGGFKPIISSKTSAAPVAEERSSIDEESEAIGASDQHVQERGSDISRINEESDSEEEEELIKQSASEIITAIDNSESGKNPFEGQQPETFEPMFIPSPPDRNALRNGTKKVVPVGIPEDLVPPVADVDFNHRLSNNRKSGSNHPFTMIRPRPNLVRRPLYPNNLVPPFRIPARGGSPTFRYQQAGGEEGAVVVDETPMAAQRMDTYYLPPDDSTGAGVVVTYDGKTVSSESGLTAPGNLGAVEVRSSGGTEELIRRTPQFGPYLGEIPPPIPDVIHPEDIPQLRKDTQHSSAAATFPDPPPINSTQLHMATYYYERNNEPTPESSEIDVITAPLVESKLNKVKKSSQKKATSSRFDSEEIMSTVDDRWPFPTTLDGVKVTDMPSDATPTASQGSTQQHSTTKKNIGTSTTTEEAKRTRERRSPHHEPGHVGETHEHHDHDMHKEQQSPTAQACSLVTMNSSIMIMILSTVVYLW